MKSPKIAAIPVLSMTLLCVLVPAAISQTSLLMIPAGGMALLIGWVLFKKGSCKNKEGSEDDREAYCWEFLLLFWCLRLFLL